RFDESVMQAYDPWVIRKSWKDGRYWGHRWQSDWDYDELFDLKPDVDYVMGADGKLINPEEQKQGGNKRDNLEKSIQESQKKIEEEQKKIDENTQRLNDTSTSKLKEGSLSEIRKEEANTKVSAYSPLAFAALFN